MNSSEATFASPTAQFTRRKCGSKKKFKTYQQKTEEAWLEWGELWRAGSTAGFLPKTFDGEVYELGLECCATSSFTWATVAAIHGI